MEKLVEKLQSGKINLTNGGIVASTIDIMVVRLGVVAVATRVCESRHNKVTYFLRLSCKWNVTFHWFPGYVDFGLSNQDK